jgi:hypothetical protein
MASVAIRTASMSPLAKKRAMWFARRAMKAARPSEVSQTHVAFRRETLRREASLSTFRDVSRPFATWVLRLRFPAPPPRDTVSAMNRPFGGVLGELQALAGHNRSRHLVPATGGTCLDAVSTRLLASIVPASHEAELRGSSSTEAPRHSILHDRADNLARPAPPCTAPKLRRAGLLLCSVQCTSRVRACARRHHAIMLC